MTCKDCLHYKRCKKLGIFNVETLSVCDDFSDRSEWVHLPKTIKEEILPRMEDFLADNYWGERKMKNYIIINGKKAELTEEQLRQLGINTKVKRETPFTRCSDKLYWYINSMNTVIGKREYNSNLDNTMYNNINYFNDREFAEQMSLKWLLYRKLEKYAWDNGAEDVEWDCNNDHFFIFYNYVDKNFNVAVMSAWKANNVVYFSDEEVAKSAIKDVVKPFMEEYPEFVW